MQVTYTAARAHANDKIICLPEPPRSPNQHEIAVIRGWADSFSLALACHDKNLHRKLLPDSDKARSVFEALEGVRVEALGSNRMPGMALNLTAKIEDQYNNNSLKRSTSLSFLPLEEALALIVRERLTGLAAPNNAKNIVDTWRDWIEQRAASCLNKLDCVAEDQERFGREVHDLLQVLELSDQASSIDEEEDTVVHHDDGGQYADDDMVDHDERIAETYDEEEDGDTDNDDEEYGDDE